MYRSGEMFDELPDMSEYHINVLERIGSGAYGIVYRAYDNRTEEVVAIKAFQYDEIKDDGIPSDVIREITALRQLSHPNIVNLIDAIMAPNVVYAELEYLPFDLMKVIVATSHVTLPVDVHRSISRQILKAMSYLHRQSFIHRDIKPSNILINAEGVIKIADFGLSRFYTIPSQQYSTNVVTVSYRAPELLLGSTTYTPLIDIWSVGCVMAEVGCGKKFICEHTDAGCLRSIFGILDFPDENDWEGVDIAPDYILAGTSNLRRKNGHRVLSQILNKLNREAFNVVVDILKPSPVIRINAIQALSYPYFANYPDILVPLPVAVVQYMSQ